MTRPDGPRRSLQDRIAHLEQRRAELDASLADARAQARQADRDDETRLRLLLGRLVREGLPHSPRLQDYVRRELPARLTQRDRDRELWHRLFPNEPLPTPPEPAGEAEDPAAARHCLDDPEEGRRG